MSHQKKLLCIILCAVLLTSMTACSTTPDPTETPPPYQAMLDKYIQLKSDILTADNLQLEIETTKDISIGKDTFSTTSSQSVTYAGLQGNDLTAFVDEEFSSEGQEDTFQEYYSGGMLYTTVYDEHHFKGEMTQEAFLDRLVPAVLLDETLYESIAASDTSIMFSNPTAAESWALPAGAKMQTASGLVSIPEEGGSLESSYEIRYTYGGTTIALEVNVAVTVAESVSVPSPDADTEYTTLSYVDAPRLLDLSLLTTLCSEYGSTLFTESITCFASGTVCSRQYDVSYYGTRGSHMSHVDYSVTAVQGNQSSSLTQTEHYEDGKYTLSTNGGTPEPDPRVDADIMFDYCQSFLSDNVPALDYLVSAEATDLGSVVYLEFGCSEEYGHLACDYICSILYAEENFLDGLSKACTTKEASFHLAIDLVTGLPTAVGIHYVGSHTIEGVAYDLVLDATQSVDLASFTAYENITGEPEPAEAPAESPTPLFYHVTGENGQEMWLLGTIHVGDSRTGYLPQEIYDAFAASDALALEFDSDAYEAALENDPAFLQQLLACYIYADGSTVTKHLDKELYEQAVKLLKASGSYSSQMEYIKPVIWMSEIENYYLRLGYQLTNGYGLENQLGLLAAEQNKPIRDIESALLQVQMLTGFSDALQQMLLEQTLSTSAWEYCSDTAELYELWCSGNENVLREYLNEEASDLTDEEQRLYEEYYTAMSTNRNKEMLDAAKEYLESGETVFYAVGLAHLLDSGSGLVDALREAGYTVELVTYN